VTVSALITNGQAAQVAYLGTFSKDIFGDR
jgi:hypothetical protein